MTYQEEMYAFFDAMGQAGTTACLYSDPGVGKTAVIEEYARSRGYYLEKIVGATREPTDFLGLPTKSEYEGNPVTEYAPPGWYVRLIKYAKAIPEKFAVLFLDELTTSPPAVQAAMLTLVQSREIGNLKLPDNVMIICAANPIESAADGWLLSPPLANRICHRDFMPPVSEYLSGLTVAWERPMEKKEADLRIQLVAFLQGNRELIQALPENEEDAAGAWPSRRSWDHAIRAMSYVEDQALADSIMSGFVGQAAAARYIAFSDGFVIPDPEKVLTGEVTVDWEEQPADLAYAIIASVTAYVTQSPKYWNEAVGVYMRAASSPSADAAAALVTDLFRIAPADAEPPFELIAEFNDILVKAGLI